MLFEVLLIILLVILAVWLGLAYNPLFWLILLVAAIVFLARRGTWV